MHQPDPSASVNSNSNMAQLNNNFTGSSALMSPPSNHNAQSTLNSNKNKDASNGANTKPGRTPRSGLSGGGSGGGNGGQVASGGGRRGGGRRRGGGGGGGYGGGGAKHRQDADTPASFRNYKNNFQPKQHQATSAIASADEFEAGSVFHPGSKKQNLNHLLNFQFEPRGQKQGQNHQGRAAYQRGKKRAQDYAPKPKYIKEQYLQANCQFAVRSGPDYARHLSDPDLLVDWDLIEQVVLKTSAKVPNCPICLCPPVAAKITRCGHVYCWTCMLHYLSLSDDESRKCPICFEEVAHKDLKSVVSVPMREFKMGEEIELTLMRRERNSLFALPVDEYFAQVNAKHPNIGESPNNFSQLVTADPQQVSNMILSREKSDLLVLLQELRDDPTVCYVEQALQMLAERESSLALHAINIDQVRPDIPEGANIEEDPAGATATQFDIPPPKGPESAEAESTGAADLRRDSSSSEASLVEQVVQEEDDEETNVTAKDLDFSAASPDKQQTANAIGGAKSKLGVPKETFYFYQCSDGQPIFLHALNVQMLMAEYGSFENCPKNIRGRILERDSASMTLELRNKLRYLTHIPVTCAFEVVEIELREVSKRNFPKEITKWMDDRRTKRNKRAKDEKRREQKIRVVENKIMGKYTGPKKNLHLESEVHFPGISGTGAEEGEDERQRGVSESSARSIISTDNDYPAMSPPPGAGASSFARMLSKAPRVQPKMMTRSETFPGPARVRRASDSEPEPEWVTPPPKQQSIGDALASALACASIEGSGTSSGSSGKKKGKKAKGFKKLDLFPSARPTL